jgi:hypothetical protein
MTWRGRGCGRGWAQGAGGMVAVESQAPGGSAEADRAELLCVPVDPVAAHSELLGELRGVKQSHRRLPRWLLAGEQLADTLSDLLDVLRVEFHRQSPRRRFAERLLLLAQCWMRARAIGT